MCARGRVHSVDVIQLPFRSAEPRSKTPPHPPCSFYPVRSPQCLNMYPFFLILNKLGILRVPLEAEVRVARSGRLGRVWGSNERGGTERGGYRTSLSSAFPC
jgi:hypothetical protein